MYVCATNRYKYYFIIRPLFSLYKFYNKTQHVRKSYFDQKKHYLFVSENECAHCAPNLWLFLFDAPN